MMPVLLAVYLSAYALFTSGRLPLLPGFSDENNEPMLVLVRDAGLVEIIFDRHGYYWPPQSLQQVPNLVLESLPLDMRQIVSSDRRKSLFFRLMLPIILLENDQIRQDRHQLLRYYRSGWTGLDEQAQDWLARLAKRYRIKGELGQADTWQAMLARVDEVPLGLALAQAANESGWGTSRFSRQGNNLYGQWTYNASMGMLPAGRDEGMRHRVRIFPTLRDSVHAYFHNLNAGFAYGKFRDLRAAMRAEGKPLDAVELAAGLERYSELGLVYIEKIQQLIRSNRLIQLGDHLRVASTTASTMALPIGESIID